MTHRICPHKIINTRAIPIQTMTDNAAATAQTGQECSNLLRIRRDYGTDGSQEKAPGTAVGFSEAALRINGNWHARFTTYQFLPFILDMRYSVHFHKVLINTPTNAQLILLYND